MRRCLPLRRMLSQATRVEEPSKLSDRRTRRRITRVIAVIGHHLPAPVGEGRFAIKGQAGPSYWAPLFLTGQLAAGICELVHVSPASEVEYSSPALSRTKPWLASSKPM